MVVNNLTPKRSKVPLKWLSLESSKAARWFCQDKSLPSFKLVKEDEIHHPIREFNESLFSKIVKLFSCQKPRVARNFMFDFGSDNQDQFQ